MGQSLPRNLIDVVSKNGIVLLNISPKSDGSIPEEQKKILQTMGKWLKTYGEAIYETRARSEYGTANISEGRHGGQSATVKYSANDIRFTESKDHLCDIDSKHLKSVADEIEQKQGSRPKEYKDYQELPDKDNLQAVIVATPPHWHALQFIAACEKGLDIYCRQPIWALWKTPRKPSNQFSWEVADMVDPDQVMVAGDSMLRNYAQIDVWINNVGVSNQNAIGPSWQLEP